jgi:tetratricopeptide (TPR) repeat protein
MRTLVASALYVSLAAGLFAQQTSGGQGGEPELNPQQLQRLVAFRKAGNYQAAEKELREWLTQSPSSVLSLKLRNYLAHMLREEGQNAEARKIFDGVLADPAATRRVRLNALAGIADIDVHFGDCHKGIEEWNETLDIARELNDEASEALALQGLGHAWLTAGSTARAEPLLRRAIVLEEKDPNADPMGLATSLSTMGEYYRSQYKLGLAEDCLTRALKINREVFGDWHPQVAALLQMLADVYSERGEITLAADYAKKAVTIMRQCFGDDSPATATALANLALVEQRANTPGDAASHYANAILVLRNFPELWPNMKVVMQRYASLLRSMHRDHEAKLMDIEAKGFRSN